MILNAIEHFDYLKNSIYTRGVYVCIVQQVIIMYLIFQTSCLA